VEGKGGTTSVDEETDKETGNQTDDDGDGSSRGGLGNRDLNKSKGETVDSSAVAHATLDWTG
jgi:hypothetical protein